MAGRTTVCKGLICGVVSFIILIVVVAFYFSLQNFIKDEESHSTGMSFYPNDTRTLSYIHPLCQRVTLSIGKNRYSYAASISVLKSVPKLSKQPNFNFVDQPKSSSGYVDYKFHFYPGSDLNVSACYFVNASTRATFYMLKGDREFNELVKSKTSKSKNKFEISEHCQQGNTSHGFTVDSEDYYHLVFYSPSNGLDGISASLTIGQVQYSIGENDVLSTCSVTNESQRCSVSIPVKASATLLSFTSPSVNWTFFENTLMSSCSPRPWMVLVISLGSTFSIIVLILLTVGVLYACLACKRRFAPEDSDCPGDKTPLVRDTPQRKEIN